MGFKTPKSAAFRAPQSGRLRTVPAYTIGVFICLCAGVLLWWLATRETKTDREIEARLATLRASGEPVDASDLARLFPNPPRSQDAHQLLSNVLVFAARNPPPSSTPLIESRPAPNRLMPLPEPALSDLLRYQEQTKHIWTEWPGQQVSNMVFAPNWDRGMLRSTPAKFQQLRSLAHMLTGLALVAADEGDTARATEMLERGLQLSRALPPDSLVQHMIARAILAMNLSAGERCFNRAQFTKAQLQRLQTALPPRTNQFAHALRGEHCLAIWAFREAKAGRNVLGRNISNDPWWERLWDNLRWGRRLKYSDEDLLRYLELYESSLKILNLSATEAITRSPEILQQYQTNAVSEMGQAVPAHWTKALQADLEIQARMEAFRISIAIEQFRLRTGSLPDSLNALVPEYLSSIPADVFDSTPMRFKRLPAGYAVYSIGPDTVDHAGMERTNAAVSYDVTIIVER